MSKIINQEKKDKKTKEKNPILEESNTRIFKNILIAILIMLYFVAIYVSNIYVQEDIFTRGLQVATMILLLISIIVFEVAYKKDSGVLAISGIEALILACHALSLRYITTLFSWDIGWYVTISGYVFAIYFVFKSIIIYTSGRKKYLNSFSDIAEIVKKDKPVRKEAIKRNTNEDEENEKEGVKID